MHRVSAQLLHSGPEVGALEECPQRGEQFVVNSVGPKAQVVGLAGDRDEVEPEGSGGGQDAHPGIGAPGGDGGGHGEVGVLLPCVAGYLLGVETAAVQLVVQQGPGAGAALPVHVAQAGTDEVARCRSVPAGCQGRRARPWSR